MKYYVLYVLVHQLEGNDPDFLESIESLKICQME